MLFEPLNAHLEAAKQDALLFARWRIARRTAVRSAPPSAVRKLLVYPSDPEAIVGAVGDDAMIGALADHYGCPIAILVSSTDAAKVVEGLGHTPVVLPGYREFPASMARLIEAGGYDCVVAMGADILDGHYGAQISKQMLITVDLAARLGRQASVLGFSFNASPAPELAKYVAGLDRRVAVNARDALSHGRLKAFARVRTRLVADSAFTLKPGKADPETAQWIATERGQGRTVVAFNLHPHLVQASDVGAMVLAAATAIRAVGRKRPVSWLLLPHDYRGASVGDQGVLEALFAEIGGDEAVVSRYFAGTHRARDIKALAGQLDGVVTGRMHLAIAALGMGVPVLCAAYQDKFAGLYRHFGLDENTLLGGPALTDPQVLSDALEAFLDDLSRQRTAVGAAWPAVSALAQVNFAPAGDERA